MTADAITMAQVQFLLNPPSFTGYQSTSQSLANQTWTGLNINTVTEDPYTGWSSATPSRYTVKVPGTYTVSGVYAPAANSTGIRAVRLQKNGSPVLGAASYLGASSIEMGIVTPTIDVALVAGDYLEVAGWQSSGGALSTILDVDLRCALWIRYSRQ